MKIARVFPRKTNATPDDDLVFFGSPPLLIIPEIDEVHVSVTFTYDRQKAEELAEDWRWAGVPVKLGGPAYDDPATGEFVPGRYIKKGRTITSRGCNNRCWFCSAWRREGKLRELEIKDGWDVLDNNLLQCSEEHIRAVFEMLKRQPERPKFTGGLEAKELKPWHCDLLRETKTRTMYFAYDTPDDYEPLVEAGWTEGMCRQWCEENDLLSPIYATATRGGCWFCHNQGVNQLRLLQKKYPDLWALMLKWDNDSPVTFKADGHTVHDFDRRFQMEDEGLIYPDDKVFRWEMLDQELNMRWF